MHNSFVGTTVGYLTEPEPAWRTPGVRAAAPARRWPVSPRAPGRGRLRRTPSRGRHPARGRRRGPWRSPPRSWARDREAVANQDSDESAERTEDELRDWSLHAATSSPRADGAPRPSRAGRRAGRGRPMYVVETLASNERPLSTAVRCTSTRSYGQGRVAVVIADGQLTWDSVATAAARTAAPVRDATHLLPTRPRSDAGASRHGLGVSVGRRRSCFGSSGLRPRCSFAR